MAFRQAVIQLGGWSIKAGLWETTFLPSHVIPAHGRALYDTLSASDSIADEDGLEALLWTVLRDEIRAAEPLGEATVLLVLPAAWGRRARAALLRMLLAPRTQEGAAGVAGVFLADAALCCAFAVNAPSATALVVDAGHRALEVAAVVEGDTAAWEAAAWPEGPWDPAAAAQEAARACAAVLSRVEPDRRPGLLEALVVTGGRTAGPDGRAWRDAVVAAVASALVAATAFGAEHQARSVRALDVPEYYGEEVAREAGPHAAWFGGGVTAKMVLGDARQLVTREEFAVRGRRVLHTSASSGRE